MLKFQFPISNRLDQANILQRSGLKELITAMFADQLWIHQVN